MGNYTNFLDIRKSYERQASKKFYYNCSKNSRSQIVLQTDIFPKLTLGAPDKIPGLHRKRNRSMKRGNVDC